MSEGIIEGSGSAGVSAKNRVLPYRLLLAPMVLLVLIVPVSGLAHSGFLDKNGCHNNNKKHTFECHDGLLKGQTFKTQAEALKALEKAKKIAATSSKKSPAVQPNAQAGQKQNPAAPK